MIQGKQIGKTDEWYTPKYIFDALYCRFDLDVAAPVDLTYVTTPTDNFIHENSLKKDWFGFVWCNPPFGGRNGILPWIEKIAAHNNGIILTPDRISTPWWNKVCLQSDAVLFISGKVKFINQNGISGDQPANGTCLFAFGEDGVRALVNAKNNGLGVLLINHT